MRVIKTNGTWPSGCEVSRSLECHPWAEDKESLLGGHRRSQRSLPSPAANRIWVQRPESSVAPATRGPGNPCVYPWEVFSGFLLVVIASPWTSQISVNLPPSLPPFLKDHRAHGALERSRKDPLFSTASAPAVALGTVSSAHGVPVGASNFSLSQASSPLLKAKFLPTGSVYPGPGEGGGLRGGSPRALRLHGAPGPAV